MVTFARDLSMRDLRVKYTEGLGTLWRIRYDDVARFDPCQVFRAARKIEIVSVVVFLVDGSL